MTASTTASSPSLDRATFLRGLGKLIANFRSSLPAEGGDALKAAWWESVSEYPWLTDAVFDAAVSFVLIDQRKYLPTVGEFLDYCRDALQEMRRAAVKALPAPVVTPSRPDPIAFARNVAIGRLRARRRFALIAEYRRLHGMPKHGPVPEEVWRGACEPTDDEVDDFLLSEAAA